ncbi:MAG: type II toxin-antitoxin system ParD family antitoxin [Phycisphaerales bacterium]|nr:type II toxin-antitoxin system ParD family antitoxin [Phycisphaerales bacterium]
MRKRIAVELRLPEALKTWIDARVARGEYRSADDCVEAALRRAKQVHSRTDVESAAEAGLQSGRPTPLTDVDWKRLETLARRGRTTGGRSRRKTA